MEGNAVMHVYSSKASITVSSIVWRDSVFPFKDKQKLEVEIKGKELIIRRQDKSKGEQVSLV